MRLENVCMFNLNFFGGQEIDNNRSINSTAVAIYARVSTAKQKKSGNLERQQQRLETYANNQGYQVIQVYKEVASGVNDRRRVLRNQRTVLMRAENSQSIDMLFFDFIFSLVKSRKSED